MPIVLTYHSLDHTGSVISTPPAVFRAQMEFLARSGASVVPLSSITSVADGIALTFDDGVANFYTTALPVLAEFRLPATVFVVSGYCGRNNRWPSQPASGIPTLDLMSWSQLRELPRHGISLGAHTVTHPRLNSLPEREIEMEIAMSRREVEDRTGAAADTFAYPYGAMNTAARECAGRWFRMSCTTEPAAIAGGCDPARIPRVDAYYLRNRFWFESLGSIHGKTYLFLRRMLHAVRQHVLTG